MPSPDFPSGADLPRPERIPDFTGYGAVIPLDYANDNRDEKSILLFSEEWDSLLMLLARPQAFMNDAKQSFLNTPAGVDWIFREPMTIVLEPLTVPTSGSIKALMLLKKLWPANGDLNDALTDWVGKPVSEFAQKVKAAFSSSGVGGNKVCRGAYFAEFAANTRALIIRYIEPDSSEVSNYYNTWITPITFSIVTIPGTPSKTSQASILGDHFTAFAHVDLAVEADKNLRTEIDVSMTRAQFVMDYLVDPAGLLTRLEPSIVPSSNGGYTHFETTGSLNQSGQALSLVQTQGTTGYHNGTKLYKYVNPPINPTVVIESVVPSPSEVPDVPNPPPFICVVVWVEIRGGGGYWTIEPWSTEVKGYVEPELPGRPVGPNSEPPSNQ